MQTIGFDPRRAMEANAPSMTMRLRTRVIAIAAIAVSLCPAIAAGTDIRIAQAGPGASSAGRPTTGAENDRFGTRADGMPFDREIRLADTRSIGVWRFETINFVTADGGAFRWRFDTVRELDAFPLASIAPAGASVPADARVYVNGQFPISP